MNNLRLEGATHAEAVKIIKSSPMLIMIVRYIGKVPQVNLLLCIKKIWLKVLSSGLGCDLNFDLHWKFDK